MSNVPKLRFPELEGGWEKKKLKDVGNSVIGLTYSPKDISDKGYLVLRACNIKDNQLAFNDQLFVNTRIPEKLKIHKGDILICARSGSQHLIGKNAYIDKDFSNHTFGAFMCVFRCERSAFVFQGFQTSRIKKQILENQGARINQITTANINAFSMYFPGINEQTKIAAFLTLIDKKIAKQDEKVAALAQYKKGLMQKIFAREIRFKDDNGKDYPEWSTRKFNDLIDIIEERAGTKKYTLMSVTAGVGLVTQVEKFGKEIAGNAYKNYYVIKRGDFAYNKSATKQFPEGYIAMLNGHEEAALPNSIFVCFRITGENTYPKIFDHLFHANYHGSWLRKFIAVGARAHGSLNIDTKHLLELPVALPSYQEQTKIANFLTLFDCKIEKEKEKLGALREQKKGLLQQMFV